MQRSPQDIKDTLLKALDQDYNVIDMPVVVEIIGILEHTPITKETLESTRLGKYVNELRRKTSDESVAKRAKDLVRKWRHLIVPDAAPGGNGVRSIHKITARTGQVSPGLPARLSQPASPSSRVSSLSPENKYSASPAISPAISPRLPGYSPLPGGRLSAPVSPAESPTPASRPRGRPASAVPPATPPCTSPPRQRGRPPKNKNKDKRPLSPSPTNDLVPKSSPANKRLRKDSPEPADHVRANGVCAADNLPGVPTSEVPSETRKRGRRRGSRNSRHDEEDLVKEAMASIARTPKVKTTRELLQSIQQESSLDHLRIKTLSSLGVAKPNKSDKSNANIATSHKFLRSHTELPSKIKSSSSSLTPEPKKVAKTNRTIATTAAAVVSSPRMPTPTRPATPPSPTGSEIIDVEQVSGCEDSPMKSPTKPVKPETVEEILAQLPKIRRDEILWSDTDSEIDDEPEPRLPTDEDVNRLHEEHIEGLNGNYSSGLVNHADSDGPHSLHVPVADTFGTSPRTCPNDCAFREWYETFSRTSYNGELLHILPYVIID